MRVWSGLTAGVLAFAFSGVAHAAPMTADAMWRLARLGAPTVSPDGRNAVVSVSTFDIAKNARSSDLYLLSTEGGPARRLTSDPSNEGEPQWSPDGRHIAFTAKRAGDDAAQIYVLPVEGGEARRITAVPTGAERPVWMPDGQRIAFVTRVWTDLEAWEDQAKRLKERAESKMTAKVWTKAPVTYWDEWIDDRQAHIYVAALEGGSLQAVTLKSGVQPYVRNLGPDAFDVSPDGAEIAFASDVDMTGRAPNLDVFTVPVAGGPAVNLTPGSKADDDEPKYGPDGRFLAWGQQRIPGFYADTRRLVLHDRRSGASRVTTENWDRSVSGLVWAPDGQSLYGAIDDAGTRRVYRFDVRGGAPAPITAANDFSNLAIDGPTRTPTLVALRQSFSEPPTLVRLDLRTGKPTKLSTFNDAALAGFDFGAVESVTYKGANDVDIQMWVIKPPNFDPSKKYPLFLLLHGGPHNAITDAWTWRWNAHVFAGWGYVVAWHNFHGSSGFGQAFTDSINPNRADKPYEDTIKAARWFTDQPWIDANRMVAGGGSYGGYLATTLLGREHPFQALIAHAAVYNNYTQVAADYGAAKDRFFEFWERPEEFQRYSPHMAAGNFKTPTLVIHGQQDFRVPWNHGLELFHTLQKRGVESKLVYYPNENHWILQPQNSIFWYATVEDWVKRFAKPGPQGGSGAGASGQP